MSTFRRRSLGITLVEILVGLMICGFVAGVLYRILLHARWQGAMAVAKGQAKDMAGNILKMLDRDITLSKADVVNTTGTPTVTPTFSVTNGGKGCTMEINASGTVKTVTYTLNGKDLSRSEGGASRIVCRNVEDLEIVAQSKSQVRIEVKTGVIAEGRTKPEIHHERLLSTIREAVEANLDPRWRNSNDANNDF